MDHKVYLAFIDFLSNNIYIDADRELIKSEWTEKKSAIELQPLFEAYASSLVNIGSHGNFSQVAKSSQVTTPVTKKMRARATASALHNFQRQGGSLADWNRLSMAEKAKYKSTTAPVKVRSTTDFAVLQTYLSYLSKEKRKLPKYFETALEYVRENSPDKVQSTLQNRSTDPLAVIQDFATTLWIPAIKTSRLGQWFKLLVKVLPNLNRQIIGPVLDDLIASNYLTHKFPADKQPLPSESEIKDKYPELSNKIINQGQTPLAIPSVLRSLTTPIETTSKPNPNFESLPHNAMKEWFREHDIKGYSDKTRSELIQMYRQLNKVNKTLDLLKSVRFDAAHEAQMSSSHVVSTPSGVLTPKSMVTPIDNMSSRVGLPAEEPAEFKSSEMAKFNESSLFEKDPEQTPFSPPLADLQDLTREEIYQQYHKTFPSLIPSMSKKLMIDIIKRV